VQVTPTAIPEVKLVRPARHGDARGWFSEIWHRERFAEAGIALDFVQDNLAHSATAGTLRGLHFQRPPGAQSKLVRVLAGRIFDVAVDLRPNSPTYRRHVAVELSAEDGAWLLVPKGFAHGYLTLEPETLVLYKVDAYYAPSLDGGIAFDDPELAIPWPLPPGGPILSEKDRRLPRLSALDPPPFAGLGEPT
jgi:dTDP-4-dehydrorhamnose 3,5-epimerase